MLWRRKRQAADLSLLTALENSREDMLLYVGNGSRIKLVSPVHHDDG
jgi:hypothetical protein